MLADVKADERLERIPVVVLTSSPIHQEILQAENLHVENYLTKPVDFEKFLYVVKLLRKYLLTDVLLPQ